MSPNGRRIAVLVSLLAALAVSFHPRPIVLINTAGPREPRSPVDRFDHGPWSELLGQYVDEHGLVDYAAWKASDEDRRRLDEYLDRLATASFPDDANRSAVLVYWINAYNAVTVAGILREYPTASIRNHTPWLFGYNIWRDLKLAVGDTAYSLEQIEHQILRTLGEPRIHFAIVCASVGCPKLRREAYTAERLEEQLGDNAQEFFADRSKLAVNPRRNTLAVSPILQWFASDFGADETARLETIRPWLPPGAQALIDSGQARLAYLEYDWRLNDRPR